MLLICAERKAKREPQKTVIMSHSVGPHSDRGSDGPWSFKRSIG